MTLLEKQFKSKANGRMVTQRLYRCNNGWSLGARRGGALTLSDDDTWEIFVLNPVGFVEGESAGFVDDVTLARGVARLAAWPVVV